MTPREPSFADPSLFPMVDPGKDIPFRHCPLEQHSHPVLHRATIFAPKADSCRLGDSGIGGETNPWL